MKIYISSTYQDLREHRAAVDRTLRRMGHDVIGMEQYVAEGNRPLDRCLADVQLADLYIVIVAWRYGYVPKDQPRPGGVSITQLEYEHALKDRQKPVLAFLLEEAMPWPAMHMDAMAARPGSGAKITRFREHLGTEHLAGMFRGPEDLASQVAAAVSVQGINRFMVDRAFDQTSVSATDMGAFGQGTPLNDSTIISIKRMAADAGSARALIVDLGTGNVWWSTRLFLLASLLRSLTGVRQLVFRDASGRFCGMASPDAVLDGLARVFPLCARFLEQSRQHESSADTERETDRQLAVWRAVHESRKGPAERVVKVGVRGPLLAQWLGERLVTRCIRVDQPGMTMAQVQQVVDSLLPDVPIERQNAAATTSIRGKMSDQRLRWTVQVVDRDAFALELAREWVRAGIPRNPAR